MAIVDNEGLQLNVEIWLFNDYTFNDYDAIELYFTFNNKLLYSSGLKLDYCNKRLKG